MPYIEDQKQLHEYRRSVFGNNVTGDPPMPLSYVAALRRLTEGADVVLGRRVSDTARQAFWLRGGTLGLLSCTGTAEEDATVDGRIVRLGALPNLEIEVAVVFNKFEGTGQFGRVLKIADDITLAARPQSASPEILDAIEAFIDKVIAAHAAAQ